MKLRHWMDYRANELIDSEIAVRTAARNILGRRRIFPIANTIECAKRTMRKAIERWRKIDAEAEKKRENLRKLEREIEDAIMQEYPQGERIMQ